MSQRTAIDISPSTLAYQGVAPGEMLSEATASEENFTHVELENIGSTNITQVWMNASVPQSNPFGTGVTGNYDAGNFIQIKPESDPELQVNSNGDFTFVNRKEFNETDELSYIFTPSDSWDYGRFRLGEQEVFWAINTSGSSCQTGSGQFRVGVNPHNQTATGSNDFRTVNGEYTSYSPVSVPGGVVAQDVWINTSSTTRQYDVKLECGGASTTAIRSRYNPGVINDTAESAVTPIVAQSGNIASEAAMQPGENFAVNVSVNVPQGVARGQVDQGTLRVLASTQ
ncbi:MAG: hypothetical protein ABEJ83_03060 [Candidatus Nanohaloarchaea archaeon]